MENELSHVVDALPGLVWTARPEGHIDFLNRRWCEYTGHSVDEDSGWGWKTVIHPDDLPELLERWQSGLDSGEAREMEARLRRADGAYRRFLVRASPMVDESGRVVKWCGMYTDIEDRSTDAQFDSALNASEARKTAILDSALDCIVTIDSHGCITEFNPASERTFGHRRDEVVGKPLADVIIPPSLREMHRRGFARYLATGEGRVVDRRGKLYAHATTTCILVERAPAS